MSAKPVKQIDFMKIRNLATAFSLLLVLASIVSLSVRGLNFGLDFTGGTLIEVSYQTNPDLTNIRTELEQAGYKDPVVQYFGEETEVLIRLGEGYTPEMADQVMASLQADGSQVVLQRSEFVGSQVGDELREQGGLGMLLALGVVMLYVAFRFQLKFSVGAVVALAHDVIITLGFFSFFHKTFDLTVLAAILAVIGYSLNDTIVVADRIRENFRKVRKLNSYDIINLSLNETLSRTLFTSLTTLMVLFALFYFGGEIIHGFAMALSIGIFIGTYSSIYVASNILLYMHISKEDLIVPVREGEELDSMP